MPIKISDKVTATAYHINDGPCEMYVIDANHAVSTHPDEWSLTPWDPQSAEEARKRLHDRQVAEAEATGRPAPPAPVAPQMTDEDRDAFEQWKAERDAAAERLAALDKENAEKAERDARIAADRALVDSPPPQPAGPVRRPLAGAAKANAERKAEREAADRKVVEDKAEADRLAGNVARPKAAT